MELELIEISEKEAELLLHGRIDSSNAGDVEEVMLDLADQYETLTLNYKDLNYITSAGLRSLAKLLEVMDNKDGNLYLTNVNSMIMEVFEMTGYAGLLNIR